MDPHHRKIDLQSPSDLTFLHNNIKKAASEKLDQAIPPSAAPAGEDDAYRSKVEELVHQYISQTLTLALPSLSINGLDATSSLLDPAPPTTAATVGDPFDTNNPNYEPYDPHLAQKLRTLYATLEVETTRVAELRREAPGQAARTYVDSLKEEIARDGRAWSEMKEEVVRAVGEEEELGVKLERAEEVRERWERATKGLDALRGVTEEVAKGERAVRVVREVEGG